jgi:hypothetical protein
MKERISAALSGRSYWLKLKNKFDIDDGGYVVLMPDDDRELNKQTLVHIDGLIENHKAKGVAIVTSDNWVIENAGIYTDNKLSVITAAEHDIDNLLSFFELYAFTERLFIMSLTKPYGNKLHNVVGMQGVTKEDIVKMIFDI